MTTPMPLHNLKPSCNRNFSLVEGFNPAVKLTRTQTVMEGASYCDFRFDLRRPQNAPST